MIHQRRCGFSLLEVLLSTTILLGALVVLGELARLGMSHASQSRDLARAELLAGNLMAAVSAGLVPVEPMSDLPVDEAPGWLYAIDVEPAEIEGFVLVRTTVTEELPAEKRPVSFSLARLFAAESTRLGQPRSTNVRSGDTAP